MARVSTPTARADIYQNGLRTENKNNKSGYSLDRSKPRDENDVVIVKKGQKYYTWTMYGCRPSIQLTAPTRQQLTGSDFLCQVYDLEDRLTSLRDGGYEDVEDLQDAVDEIVSEIRSLADEQDEKRNNMPEQLQDSGSGETLQNRYDSLNEWADNIEGVSIDFDKDEDQSEEEQAQAWEEYRDEVTDELSSNTYDGE